MPPYVKRRTEGVTPRVYTYKLKPDREQEALLSDTAETLRHLWNRALAERLLTMNAVRLVKLADQPEKRAEAIGWLLKERGEAFVSQVEAEVLRLSEMSEEERKEESKRVKLYEQKKRLITHARHQDDEIGHYLARVNVGLCQQTLIRLDRAFQAAWRRAAQGEKPGFPRFKRRGEFDTLQYNNLGNGCFWDLPKSPRSVPYVRLSGIGDIRVICYRLLPESAVIRNLSVTHKADGWWVNVSLEVDAVAYAPAVRPPLGLCLIPPLAAPNARARTSLSENVPEHPK